MRAAGSTIVALLGLATSMAEVRPGVHVAFGDSYTAGFDESIGGETPGYPGYLVSLLQAVDPSSVVINAGHSGESTGQGLVRLPGALDQHRPQLLLVLEGINDLRNGASAAGVAANLERMTEMARARGIIPILSSIPPMDAEISRGPIQATNQLILGIVGDGSVVGFASSYAAFESHPEYYDGSHPNQAGYQVMASVFFDGIQARGTTPPPPFEDGSGDLDDSGLVDGWDLVLMARAFGEHYGDGRYDGEEDLNYDGVVDGADLAILASSFGDRV